MKVFPKLLKLSLEVDECNPLPAALLDGPLRNAARHHVPQLRTGQQGLTLVRFSAYREHF